MGGLAPPLQLAYGPHPSQVADVWPAAPVRAGPLLVWRSTPLVLVLHGGWWRVGCERVDLWPAAADLAARGFAVALLEWRRVGQVGAGWQGTFDDVAQAVEAVPSLLAFDGTVSGQAPVILTGHGSGGQLALWAAVRHALPGSGVAWRRPTPMPVAGVVALAPVSDLADAYYRGLGGDAVASLLGGGPGGRAARYRATDPAALPVPHVPVAVMHGSADGQVPVEQSRRYAARSGSVAYFELPGVAHRALIDPGSQAWREVVVTVLDELAWPGEDGVVA
jgi:alpha-beta hydrolase superfamily lysophospholipase